MWENLKAAIASVVKANNNQEITGALLQNTLYSIVNSVGANAALAGIATLSTNPGTPDGPVFYFATEGTYPNFNGAVVRGSQIGIFAWNGSEWNISLIDAAGIGSILNNDNTYTGNNTYNGNNTYEGNNTYNGNNNYTGNNTHNSASQETWSFSSSITEQRVNIGINGLEIFDRTRGFGITQLNISSNSIRLTKDSETISLDFEKLKRLLALIEE